MPSDSTHPSLAVVAFESLNDDGAPDYFSRGFVDDLVTDLARFSDLLVIAARDDRDERSVRADFVLGGSLRRAGDRLRVSTRLVEREPGSVIWAERFDAELQDVFSIQDRIAEQVVATVSNRINATLLTAARRKQRTELAAYDYWLRGLDQLKQGSLAADEQARRLFEEALTKDPDFSRAHLGLSLTYFNEWSCQLWERWDENERLAFAHAERAHALDADDHYTQMVLGRILLFRREFDRAERLFDRALALNSNDADCLVQIAMSLAFLGRAADANAAFERSVRLNPYHESWYYAYGGLVAFAAEDYARGLEYAGRVEPDVMVDLAAYMAAGYHYTGQDELAREKLETYLRQFEKKILAGRDPEPGEALRWLKHVNPWKRPEDAERLVSAVRVLADARSDHPKPFAPDPVRNAFRRVGSLWELSYEGRDVWLPHIKGFIDLRKLIASPGQEVHAADLMGSIQSQADDASLDETARQAYEKRLRELRSELDDAQDNNDLGRHELAQREFEAIREHLSTSLALGGRARPLGAPTERARSAVTQRIRAAIKKIEAAHPQLAEHLSGSIQTGTFCVYQPATERDWQL